MGTVSPERMLQPADLAPFIGGQFAIFTTGSPRRMQGAIEAVAIEEGELHVTFDWVVQGESHARLVDAADTDKELRLPADSFFVADKDSTSIVGSSLDRKGLFFKFMRPHDIDAI